MNAPLDKEQLALLMSDNVTYRASPVQGSEAPVQRSGLGRRIGDALLYVAEFPRRRKVLDELSRLTDRELADIGLHRGELKQVFTREPH